MRPLGNLSDRPREKPQAAEGSQTAFSIFVSLYPEKEQLQADSHPQQLPRAMDAWVDVRPREHAGP
jgi:hypothetical protein